MAKFTPKTPDILNKIRLPDLDFVDVYNQPPSPDEFVDLEQDNSFDAVSVRERHSGKKSSGAAAGRKSRMLLPLERRPGESQPGISLGIMEMDF